MHLRNVADSKLFLRQPINAEEEWLQWQLFIYTVNWCMCVRVFVATTTFVATLLDDKRWQFDNHQDTIACGKLKMKLTLYRYFIASTPTHLTLTHTRLYCTHTHYMLLTYTCLYMVYGCLMHFLRMSYVLCRQTPKSGIPNLILFACVCVCVSIWVNFILWNL